MGRPRATTSVELGHGDSGCRQAVPAEDAGRRRAARALRRSRAARRAHELEHVLGRGVGSLAPPALVESRVAGCSRAHDDPIGDLPSGEQQSRALDPRCRPRSAHALRQARRAARPPGPAGKVGNALEAEHDVVPRRKASENASQRQRLLQPSGLRPHRQAGLHLHHDGVVAARPSSPAAGIRPARPGTR